LFSELSLENQRCTPRFEKLWLRAEANGPATPPLVTRFVTVLVAVTVIVVMGLAAARLWLSSSESQQATNIPAQIVPTTLAPLRQPGQLLAAASKDVVRPRRFARRPSERTAIRQAAMISKWQSPTNILLNSPPVSVLSTLPQLNQSARELEQFLPKNK